VREDAHRRIVRPFDAPLVVVHNEFPIAEGERRFGSLAVMAAVLREVTSIVLLCGRTAS
jgi:hypothetical protein